MNIVLQSAFGVAKISRNSFHAYPIVPLVPFARILDPSRVHLLLPHFPFGCTSGVSNNTTTVPVVSMFSLDGDTSYDDDEPSQTNFTNIFDLTCFH